MSIIDNVKNVAGLIHKADNIELYGKILDLQKDAMDIVEENRNLKEENRSLKKRIELVGKMIFERNTYWIIEGENKDGPFCSACWDDKNKKVRMQIRHDDSTCCDCPVCKLFVQMDKSIDLPQVSGGVDWD